MTYLDKLRKEVEHAVSKAPEALHQWLASNKAKNSCYSFDEMAGTSIAKLTNIEPFIFPNLHFLSPFELRELICLLENLYSACGIHPISQECITPGIRYKQLITHLVADIFPNPPYVADLELCDYLPQDCPYASECPAILANCQNACTETKTA